MERVASSDCAYPCPCDLNREFQVVYQWIFGFIIAAVAYTAGTHSRYDHRGQERNVQVVFARELENQ
jgi:hypothetical protein